MKKHTPKASKTKSEWGDISEKPLFSPSKLSDLGCRFRYNLRWNRRLGVKSSLRSPPTLGTLVHAGEAAIDLGLDGKKGIADASRKILEELHLPEDSKLLTQLSSEAESIVLGVPFRDGKGIQKRPESYSQWKGKAEKESSDFEIIAVEKRLYVDAGPMILAPKLDLVIENDIGLWVVERKTKSSISKDPRWFDKYRLDLQLLVQMKAAELYFKKPVRGAMLRAVLYSRQNRKNHTSDLPQGLSNVKRLDAVWLRRNVVSEALFEDLLIETRAKLERAKRENSWPAEGLLSHSCGICDYAKVCRGEIPIRNLVPLPPDDLTLEEEKRNKKLLTSAPKG